MTQLLRTARAAALAACTALALFAHTSGLAANSSDPTMPGEVLVKLKSTGALTSLLGRYPLTLVSRFGARPIYRLKVVGSTPVDTVLASLALEPEVLIAEPNTTHSSPEARANLIWVVGQPSDYVAQWGLASMRLPEAKNLSLGEGVRVAVLDTGIDYTHRLMREANLVPGRDFVDNDNDPSEVFAPGSTSYGHGTHVAGLIALAAPRASIMPLRVLDANGQGNVWVLAEALLYALDPDGNPATDDGAQVVNISLGSQNRTRIMATLAQIAGCEPAIPDDPIGDRSDPGYQDDETRCANSRGAVIVAAAGNEGSNSVKEYPAAEGAYGLIPMGASGADGRLAGFSNSGAWVNLAAPGEGITSALPGNRWGTWSGTSMAAPLATGAVALLMAHDRSITAKDVAQRLKRTASLLCGTNAVQVDAYAALANIITPSGNCKRAATTGTSGGGSSVKSGKLR